MSEYKGTPGELIYEYTLQFTQVVEYGISANAVLSGRMPPPADRAAQSTRRYSGLKPVAERLDRGRTDARDLVELFDR